MKLSSYVNNNNTGSISITINFGWVDRVIRVCPTTRITGRKLAVILRDGVVAIITDDLRSGASACWAVSVSNVRK